MANSGSNKFPISKNIIYDSGNDTPTGRKRAVELGGGVSVAERARLFGAQVTHASAAKNSKPQRPPINNQRPPINNRRPSINNQSPPIDNQPSPVNNQPPKSNIIHQDRNYQPYKTDIYRNPKYDTAYVPPQIVPNYSRPPVVQFNDKQSRNYATVNRPQNYQQQSSTRQQPLPNYDTFQRSTSEKPMPKKTNSTQIIPGESYISDRNPRFDSYERQKPVSPLRNLNYFQPIQDPLEALYKSSSQGYYQQQQQQIPTSINTNISGVQPFDLGNLIGRIQEDYLNNIRPYVSSVEFIESELNLANVGLITPSTTRKDYMRRSDDIYNQQGTKYYDVIDPNNSLYPAYSRQLYNDNNNYSSMPRRKHRRRYHDQASSPIHMPQSSDKKNQQYKPESPKASTPIVESESEEEETIATNTQADASKTTEPETSSESEEESSEHLITTPAIQHNETTRPPLPVQPPPTAAAVRTPAKSSESESSESEESNSDSESETEDDEDEKPKPSPATQSNNLRTAPATPQANTRGTPQINTRGTPQTNTRGTPQTNTRGTPQTNIRGTPQINARDAPQPMSIDTSSRNQPPEYSSSVNTFDIQNSGKSSGGGGRFKSITNKFRRKKS